MFEQLRGKKLLVISSDVNDKPFVEAAKEMGVYVICCDRYSDHNVSPAKSISDEAWDIDYRDTELIAQRCRESGVNGVIAGYGEDRVYFAAKVSKTIGTPFYATMEQIDFTRDKLAFKEKCRLHGIRTPQDYIVEGTGIDETKVHFPVIVKPSDNGGRKGISICQTNEELRRAIVEAKEFSTNGKVVVEDYISGTELIAVYTIKNGEYSLSCVNDKYNSEDANGSKLCDMVISPSKYYEEYLRDVDSGIKALLADIGAQNGVANFQFIVNDTGIYAFEMGYRINGNDDFKIIRRFNGIDFVKMLICYSLTGDMGDELKKDNPVFGRYGCTLCGYLNPGTIAKIETEGLKEKQNIFDVFLLKQVGFTAKAGQTNAQKAFMVKFEAQNLSEIKDTILFIQHHLRILDEQGNNLLMKRFDVKRLVY